MTGINSNCSRIDAVKASANQLKLQISQAGHGTPESSAYRKAQGQLDSLDQVIQKGDAQTAETALSTATSAVKNLQSDDLAKTPCQNRLDVYA